MKTKLLSIVMVMASLYVSSASVIHAEESAKEFGNTFYYFVITPDGQYKLMHLWHYGQEQVIVNGKEYKRYDWSGENESTVDSMVILRQDGKKCFCYDTKTNTEHLMFDFGLQKGDTYFNDFDNTEYEVTDVRDTIIRGESRLLIELCGQDGKGDIWVERTGSIYTGIMRGAKVSPGEAYLTFSYRYTTCHNTDHVKTSLIKLEEPIWEGGEIKTEEDWKAYYEWSEAPTNLNAEFVDDTLHVWGRIYTCYEMVPYAICALKDNQITFLLYDYGEVDGYSGYNVDARIPGFKRGRYEVILYDKYEINRYNKTVELECEGAEPRNGSFLSKGMAWVDGFGYEQDGHYKTDDVKLFYYTTVGDTLIDEKYYFRIQRIKAYKTKTYEESKYEIFDDNLCFFMREDDAGDVWLYAKDRNVFYELSGNTLYDYLADNLVGRDLFLFNAKKKYAVGDKLPLGMSALVDPNGFQESEDYWHIYSLDVEEVSERNLLDGKTYPIYNNYFLESIGPLDGPLSGIGSPNSYSLDFRQLFAFYRDGQLIYKNEGYIAALEEYFPNILDTITNSEPTEPVTFTKDQMATIILPTTPDAGKGKYYKLDRCEDGKIIFEQEKQPQPHIPYIIVPNEDFSIDTSTLDLAGLRPDTVSIAGIHFIGSYSREEPVCQEGWYIDIIDTTPDCKAEEGKAYTIGALRAYLTVNWDDPINHDGTKGLGEKLEIVLKDNPNGLTPPLFKGEGDEIVNGKWSNGKWFDLSGRRLFGKPARGIYIEDGKKKAQ